MSRLVDAVRGELKRAADPRKAPEMQRYMKSEMPYRGVAKPERAALTKKLFAEHVMSDVDELVGTTLDLWRAAEYREERYVAMDLIGDRRYRAWQNSALMPLYDEMIVTGAWWDYVDEIAIRRVGPILQAEPETMTPMMLQWSADADLWRRRTSIICQVGAKTDVDTELLTRTIEANITDKDFFLRKGIGWALRQHSKMDAAWVRVFVDTHPDLSPLSQREARKYL
nr:DNA alkylation repair protein [Kibdelosporangium sp. MJ126-NF4]